MVNMSQLLIQFSRTSPLSSTFLAYRGLSTTSCLCKNIRAGVPKTTPFKTKALTYEQAVPPSRINVRKGWLSWNTSNLEGEGRTGQTTFEDYILRKFVQGTWPGCLASEVIIKRRSNFIILSFLVSMERLYPRQVYFLKGYTEELLSHWFKCRVKVELSTVQSKNDVVFKKI